MKKTIRDYDLSEKRVLIRCDFNVPMKDGVITDDYRIQSSLKNNSVCDWTSCQSDITFSFRKSKRRK